MSQKAKIQLAVAVEQSNSSDLSTLKDSLNYSHLLELLDGTAADQANRSWSDKRTVAGSGTDSIDLGALTDAFGNSLAFTKIKAIVVVADKGNGNTLEVGGDTNAFASFLGDKTDSVILRPGGVFMAGAGDATAYAVTDSTGDIIKVTNNSGSPADYDIILVGVA